MESRCDKPAPESFVSEGRGDAVRKVNPANGQAGLAELRASRRQIPDSASLTPVTSVLPDTEFIDSYAAQKSLYPE